MGRSRDWRRAQRARIIARTERYMRVVRYFNREYYDQHPEEVRAEVCKRARTRHPCSLSCCGNPRRWFSGQSRLTMQERRAR